MSRRFWPLARGHVITSGYGPRWGTWHRGVDFGWPGGSAGKPVYAVQAGTVVSVGWDPSPGGFGHYLDIDSDDAQGANLWVYGHIVPEVQRGQQVAAGQRIAHVNGDRSTNGGVDPHCHIEVHNRVRQPFGPGRMDPIPFLQGAAYPGEAPAPEPEVPVSRVLYGIDVSNHQREFDFAAAKREGFAFATHKVTEGDGYRDPFWPRAREQMREHFPGLFGGYVFCRRASHPEREADTLLQHLGDPSIPIQLDYEDTIGGGSIEDMWARIHAIQARGMRVFSVYLPRWFWRDRMGSPNLARIPPLWNSHYVAGKGYASTLYETAPATIEAGWAGFHPGGPPVRILQFSETARVAGQLIDVNAFRGTITELRALFAGTDTGGFLMALSDAEQRQLFEAVCKPRPSLVEPEFLGGQPPAELDAATFARTADYQAFHAARLAEKSVSLIEKLTERVTQLEQRLANGGK
ncbi:peptidoglycan DD-metalloendopeptidase family protein [Rhodococcus ruber]|uniref:peptidoglycan DD-metalloendopeptidase family protein n=1 Tax=Rhodococcus ruber TaxID=1830 RepID=UPI003783A909